MTFPVPQLFFCPFFLLDVANLLDIFSLFLRYVDKVSSEIPNSLAIKDFVFDPF